jgi:hypothetical protein
VQHLSLFVYWTLFHYMFRPNWPSSGVQAVVTEDSASHCNAAFFPPIVVAFGYFGYVGCTFAFGFVWFAGCGCLE